MHDVRKHRTTSAHGDLVQAGIAEGTFRDSMSADLRTFMMQGMNETTPHEHTVAARQSAGALGPVTAAGTTDICAVPERHCAQWRQASLSGRRQVESKIGRENSRCVEAPGAQVADEWRRAIRSASPSVSSRPPVRWGSASSCRSA
jgi:hypothetical protein